MAAAAPTVNEEEIVFAEDGHSEVLETIKTPVHDSDGRLIGILGVGRDITERKQTEDALRESEERHRDILEYGGVGVAYFDLDGRFLLLNRRAVQNIGGSEASEFIGKSVVDVFGDEAGGTYLARIRETAASSEAREYVDHVELPIGSRWLASIHTRSLDAAGNVVGVQVYAQDITVLRQAEEEVLRHAEQLQRTVEGAVLAMSHMVESRDPYTAGHERRVAELATAIGVEMGMAGEQVDALRLAGTIHDIGKIAVPAEILSKPGRLSEIEFSIIQAHPTTGFDILADVDFGSPVAEMVLQHHERLDGSGYPQRAQREADPRSRPASWRSPTSSRRCPHTGPTAPRSAWRPRWLRSAQHAGIKFDADVVAACARLIEEQELSVHRVKCRPALRLSRQRVRATRISEAQGLVQEDHRDAAEPAAQRGLQVGNDLLATHDEDRLAGAARMRADLLPLAEATTRDPSSVTAWTLPSM